MKRRAGNYRAAEGQATSALLLFQPSAAVSHKGYYPFPPGTAPRSFCNDIAIGPDGSAFVTDTNNDRVLRLKKGDNGLSVWFQKDDVKGGFDGIAFGGRKTNLSHPYQRRQRSTASVSTPTARPAR